MYLLESSQQLINVVPALNNRVAVVCIQPQKHEYNLILPRLPTYVWLCMTPKEL